ncbi:hypothetical protein [Planotetraspora kaengkrachanensis]|uniref:Uncharacterized protein n=1 Tax=Planotetraspora kaengkrachanensis TaxID=575193 RepID=A0A8J3LWI0_9ACTN|nr:hypothetical protein [Planotetraspora kaengkrachanensis]GIG79977.1 hypothetical protein Pka01_31040 [Planotetraspora kaengkrachanensis]
MGRWFGLWYGGNGYSPPEPDDLEEFSSLADARAKLADRYRHGYSYRSRFAFISREPADVLTPCVGDDCAITLYGSRDALDYPDRRLFLGPHGGVRSEHC